MSKKAAIDAAAAAIMVRGEGPIVLRQLAAAIVEAAAPHLQEEAWDEGSVAGWRESGLPHSWSAEHALKKANPYRSVAL